MGRGGRGTKLHLVTCGNGLPVGVGLTPADADGTCGRKSVWGSMAVPRRRGRPRKRPAAVAADEGYDSDRVRAWFRRFGVRVVIPQRRRPARYRLRRGRPFGFDRGLYRKRNAVGRCVGWLKENRRVATRYEKLAVGYSAVVRVAMSELCLKRIETALSDRILVVHCSSSGMD